MERFQQPQQRNLFVPAQSPLPEPTLKAMLPLVAALITAVMTSTCPPTAHTGGDDDDWGAKITTQHVSRAAYVYVRQSTADQVQNNLESQRLQYRLVDRARELGWSNVEVIDDDPLPIVARLLGHRHPSMSLRYAHVGDSESEAAAERIGQAIARLIGER